MTTVYAFLTNNKGNIMTYNHLIWNKTINKHVNGKTIDNGVTFQQYLHLDYYSTD